jgi:hypothetical protein
MSREANLQEIEADRAVRESAAAAAAALAPGETRFDVLRKAGLAGRAIGGGAVLGASAPGGFAGWESRCES